MSRQSRASLVMALGLLLGACSGEAGAGAGREAPCESARLRGLCAKMLECWAGRWSSQEECESAIAAGTFPAACHNPAGWAACACESYGYSCDLLAEQSIFCDRHNCW